MDSITQAALGAVIGEAVVGHKAGKKGAIWGAVLATIPDLDVVVNPLLETTEQIAFHRGPSHSIFLLVIAGFGVGWLLDRRYGDCDAGVSRRDWVTMALLAFLSQPFLDVLTSYGTYLFWPISRNPHAFSSVSIIDPIYTFTLLISLAVALFPKTHPAWRPWATRIGLALSTGYLGLTMIVKLHVGQVFTDELDRQSITYERFEEMPAILNSVLWVGMADSDDDVYVGLYSLLDDDREIDFQRIDKNKELLEPYRGDVRVERLVRFSRGLYTVSPTDDGLLYEDLHVGRQDFWLSDDAPTIFRWELVLDADGQIEEVRRMPERGDINGDTVDRYFDRVLGE
ncbi:metal-dependent hydrolase [Persicimonas caeni]|uniref:metal-dependent hydrolase n=1 Tax=Persicimonas caeni TaxID=2292766 RepID=UPI00143D7D4F|nr:metal-dependent hydrolase [Persicimonas caeni]